MDTIIGLSLATIPLELRDLDSRSRKEYLIWPKDRGLHESIFRLNPL